MAKKRRKKNFKNKGQRVIINSRPTRSYRRLSENINLKNYYVFRDDSGYFRSIKKPEKRIYRPDLIIANKLRRKYNLEQEIKSRLSYIPNRLLALERFIDPRKMIICAGRKLRREVLFANNRVGKGRRVSDRRKYTEESKVRC